VALVRRLGQVAGTGLLEDWRARRVLDLVGDRLSVSIGPDGITVRSLVRRRHTPWARVQRLTLAGRYDLLRDDGLARLVDGARPRVTPLPVPGLKWLIRRVVGVIANWLEPRLFNPEQIDALRKEAGRALLGIKRRGRDIELSGGLLLVSILAPGLAEAAEQEARRRGIPVEVSGA
jgi:hypothetical protein